MVDMCNGRKSKKDCVKTDILQVYILYIFCIILYCLDVFYFIFLNFINCVID